MLRSSRPVPLSVFSVLVFGAAVTACDGSDDATVTRKKGTGTAGAAGTTGNGGAGSMANGGTGGSGAGNGAGAGSGTSAAGATGSGASGAGGNNSSGAGGTGAASAGGTSAAAGNGGTSAGNGTSNARALVTFKHVPTDAKFPSRGDASFPGPAAALTGCVRTIEGPCALTACKEATPGEKAFLSAGDIELTGLDNKTVITYANDEVGYLTKYGSSSWKGGEGVKVEGLGTLDVDDFEANLIAPPLLTLARPATLGPSGVAPSKLDITKPLEISWTGPANATVNVVFGARAVATLDGVSSVAKVLRCTVNGAGNKATVPVSALALAPKGPAISLDLSSASVTETKAGNRPVEIALETSHVQHDVKIE